VTSPRREVQVTFDAHDPGALSRFWAEAIGYPLQDPPPPFESWEQALEAWGVPADQRNDASALVDPQGTGPRIFFQKVPEGKTAKNRVHLDVNVGADAMHAKAEELVARGATLVEEHEEPAGHWITMRDPEGNEFCLQ
jgi:hypothetical protein